MMRTLKIGDAVLKTYEAYGKDGADATESVEDVPGTEEQISTETGEGTTGQVLQNTQIENVSSLDATSHDWGLGSHTDDENRPLMHRRHMENTMRTLLVMTRRIFI